MGSLFYVFHLMSCEDYYDHHPPYQGSGDRCSIDAVTAGTAAQYSILGMSTTLCGEQLFGSRSQCKDFLPDMATLLGTLNLFVTGNMVKKFGPRAALLLQTIIPALRVLAQILGVMAGGRTGMIIIQTTQLITIIGGPVGYMYVLPPLYPPDHKAIVK